MPRYAELHCHTDFSFLDGASAADELVERALELGLRALAVTDHQGLYGIVRFASAAEEAGLHAVIGLEGELLDAALPDPDGIVVPARRAPPRQRGVLSGLPALGLDPDAGTGGGRAVRSRTAPGGATAPGDVRAGLLAADDPPVDGGRPVRPRSRRERLPGHRDPVREDLRGIADAQRGPHLVLLARNAEGYRSLCRLVSAAGLAGTKGVPRFTHELLERHAQGLVALSGCRHGEIARRLLAGDRAGARAVADRLARLFGEGGFFLELQHHVLPDDDWLVSETATLAREAGLPVVVTNDVHYALPEDRELQDVLVAIRHGLTLDESAHLRRPNGEYHLKGADAMLALPPAEPDAGPLVRRAWEEGMATAAELAASCQVDLGFERYRFPGFPVPAGETPFSYLFALCQEGARRRYHPLTPPVVRQLAHELDVVERTGLAEFFLICWDLMRFARERSIPAQGRGSAGDSIVAYVLGITRVDPIRHHLLFERFINEGRTTYPDVDIDFASSRREEVLQYVYERYGPEHTGMVCNVVTYRARSAVREVGYALGFPRPLVDRVAKALETYDSVMVRRDLETDGGFAEFFAPAEEEGRTLARSAVRVRAEGGVGGVLPGSAGPRSATAGPGRAGGVLPGERRSGLGEDGPGGPARLALSGYSPVTPLPRRTADPSSLGEEPATPRPRDATRPAVGGSEEEDGARVASRFPVGPPSPLSLAATPGPSSLGEDGPGGPARVALPGASPATPLPRRAAGPSSLGEEGATAGVPLPGSVPERSSHGAEAMCLVLPGRGQGTVSREAAQALASATGFVDRMGQLNHPRGGRIRAGEEPVSALPDALAPRTVLRRGTSDDEGGPGDTPVSEAWLRAEAMRRSGTSRGAGHGARHPGDARQGAPAEATADDVLLPPLSPGIVAGQRLDPETGMPLVDRRIDRTGRASRRDGAPARHEEPAHIGELPRGGEGAPPGEGVPPGEGPPNGDVSRDDGMSRNGESARVRRAPLHSSVARLQPEPPRGRRSGSTVGLSPWDRWLELCARIDGKPRHLSIHVGGMLVTAAPLVDIAPLERATMPGRVVVQFDKRDVETIKLIKLDLLGLRMLSAIDDAVRDIAADCGVVVDLDHLPEDLPEVFRMIRAADTVGVFQVESRAQMQTLPKSRPTTLDDLVVEVAIIRPGPIQGNAVHPYLRRRQGTEPVTYLHPSLEPILRETLGVILYQEQVMEIAIQVAGFTAAESDGFRRAMGTWRSSREMEKLHRGFVEGCVRTSGVPELDAEELFRQVAAFASFGFNKSHAAAFARTAYESCFLKLYYPAQFVAGLVNSQPMGFYPVEVLINDVKRHGVPVLPVDLNRSRWRTTTEWAGMSGDPLPDGAGIPRRPPIVRSPACVVPDPRTRHRWGADSAAGYGIRLGLHLVNGIGEEHGERLDAELDAGPYRSLPDVVARTGLSEEVIERLIRAGALDSLGRPRRELLWQLREVAGSTGRTLARSAVRVRAGVEREGSCRGSAGPGSARTGLAARFASPSPASPPSPLSRAAAHGPSSLGEEGPRGPARLALPSGPPATPRPRDATQPTVGGSEEEDGARVASPSPASPPSPSSLDPARGPSSPGEEGEATAGVLLPGSVPERSSRGAEAATVAASGIRDARPLPLDLRLPPTEAPDLPAPTELERLADSYAILSLDARRQVVELFRPALDRMGVSTIARLAEHPCGRVSIGGLVVTRQHPMTARGTVFLALEDETGMANVTLWPDTWARLRSVVRRHALLWVSGELQREGAVVNLVATDIRSLPQTARIAGGPPKPQGVRHLGYAGMRRA